MRPTCGLRIVLLFAVVSVGSGVSFGARKKGGGGNVGSAGLLKRKMGVGRTEADKFPVGGTPGAFPNEPRGAGSRRLQGAAKDAVMEAVNSGTFPVGTGPGRLLKTRERPESSPDVLTGTEARVSKNDDDITSRTSAAPSESNGPSRLPRHRNSRPERVERDPRVSGSGLFDENGNARSKEDVMAFERDLMRRASSLRGEKFAEDTPHKKKPKKRSGFRSSFVNDAEFGKPLQPPKEPTRLARVRPDGHEHTTQSAAAGFTGLEYGRTVDPNGKEYLTHRVTDFLKAKAPDRAPDQSIVLEGDAHYEATVQEQLYHYRIHNTGKEKTVEMVTFTATLPEGSKPHHMYWIRNQRGVQRPEHHECYIKRLTVTCNVHQLASGQLATVYVHAKQRPSGHGPMIATLSVAGKQIGTNTI